MNVAIENKKIVLIGVAVLAIAAAFLVVRPALLDSSDEPATLPAPGKRLATAKDSPKAASPSKPSIVLLPGLPQPVATRLRSSKVVVVSMYVGRPSASVTEAKRGARSVGAGFVALNVLDERKARSVAAFAGDDVTVSTLVVRRPGKIVNRFGGYADAAIVAQAAVNAGAPATKHKTGPAAAKKKRK